MRLIIELYIKESNIHYLMIKKNKQTNNNRAKKKRLCCVTHVFQYLYKCV